MNDKPDIGLVDPHPEGDRREIEAIVLEGQRLGIGALRLDVLESELGGALACLLQHLLGEVGGDDVVAQTRSGKQVLNVRGDTKAMICKPVSGDTVAVVGENRKVLVFALT